MEPVAMTNIERMAKEAELADDLGRSLPAYPRRLAKFAALLIEECAKECETMPNPDYYGYGADGEEFAAAIRAKFARGDLKDAAK